MKKKSGLLIFRGCFTGLFLLVWFIFPIGTAAETTGHNTVILRGDANGDGVVNMADVTTIERMLLGLDAPTESADANGDGQIDMGDVIKVERIICGLE